MKSLADCRVLLVDDAKANLDILVEGLKADHKLSLALNGEMALQIAARTPPDLVLLDIMMPGMDGYEVFRRLRQMPETAEVPIMFLSSLPVRVRSTIPADRFADLRAVEEDLVRRRVKYAELDLRFSDRVIVRLQ